MSKFYFVPNVKHASKGSISHDYGKILTSKIWTQCTQFVKLKIVIEFAFLSGHVATKVGYPYKNRRDGRRIAGTVLHMSYPCAT